ncbi:hypothetical protein P5663_07090 [Priestia flexa]|uniref:hypothetical protein n=1 Tax=Priestia flexa TaxID=86664 RepID=UPI00240E1BB7|nr:hypothetical protein [Priestia flexa]WEZ09600.1 hypothetical protein P5663_07090 [Priestia flexa]
MWGKVQTVGTISEFMNVGTVTPFQTLIDWALHPVEHAKETGTNVAYDTIEPFLDVLTVLSYPIASVIMSIAGLLYIMNFKEKSVSWMTKTTIAYVLIQLLPSLIKSALQLI